MLPREMESNFVDAQSCRASNRGAVSVSSVLLDVHA